MAALSKANATAVFDLKSAALTVLAVVLKTTDLAALAQAMRERFNEAPGFFDNEPACIDLSAVRHEPDAPDFAELLQLLRHHGLNPVAVRGGSPEQMAAGLAAGLAEAPDPLPPARPQPEAPPALSIVPAAQLDAPGAEAAEAASATASADRPGAESEDTSARPAKAGGVLELVLRVPLLGSVAASETGPDAAVPASEAPAPTEPLAPFAAPEPAAGSAAAPALEISTLDAGAPELPARQVEELGAQALQPLPTAAGKLMPTLIYDKPLRSGQRIYARGSDLVVLGVVNFGAEVIADGSIHVYAPLRGRAIAGACGDVNARIFALSMQPQLVSIAGNWRTIEDGAFPEAAGKMAQVRLEGEKLLLEPIKG